ncbi:MAG TPA: phosphoenolpyruvate--protein phosphotransferase [Actinomycetes bacterium]|jgi:phosphotransferase system enzyme I (PtsI)|nr:phosphoenolpyruvate--protein phosphotransferase [Actinomycetes bacterium]
MAAPLKGVGVSRGVAVGPVALMGGEVPEPPEEPTGAGDPTAELAAARGALEAVAVDLEARGLVAGGDVADVLAAQVMMVRDPGLDERVSQLTAQGRSAARAVWEAFGAYRGALAGAGEYMAARVADLDDLRARAVARLLGVPVPGVLDPGHPFVLVARDLAPADTALLGTAEVLGFVTEEGGPTSHTAILAKSLGVPAVVGCAGATGLADGAPVIVDGGTGEVRVDPSGKEVRDARRRADARRAARRLAGGPGRTADGYQVALLANIGGPADVGPALAAGAEGVGLFRTEFLFLDRADPPGLDEQQAAYEAVFVAFGASGGKVVVRTLDAGADKPLAFLNLHDEPNPALGRRGLRAVRRAPEVLADQLEAIGRAAAATEAEVWVMAPMVATAEEAGWFCVQARRQPVDRAGVMIEIPSAALRAGAVLAEADFASIGTNDLSQYAFAADRLVSELAAFQDPWQPALLELVGRVGEAGRASGKPVGVCGEAAGDPLLALVLVGLGMTSLSMAPGSLPDVRLLLARHSLDDCRYLAGLALAAPRAESARARARAAARGVEELGL